MIYMTEVRRSGLCRKRAGAFSGMADGSSGFVVDGQEVAGYGAIPLLEYGSRAIPAGYDTIAAYYEYRC